MFWSEISIRETSSQKDRRFSIKTASGLAKHFSDQELRPSSSIVATRLKVGDTQKNLSH